MFVYAYGDLSDLLPSVNPIARDGFVLLGALVGSATFRSLMACKRVEKIQSALDVLPVLGNSQMECVLLLQFVSPQVCFHPAHLSPFLH